MMKIRPIPETNSSSSHALVYPPHIKENVYHGIEIINYAIAYMEELLSEDATHEFKEYLLSDPEIQEELKKHPEFEIIEVFTNLDPYSIPDLYNYHLEAGNEPIYRLYREIIKQAIKNDWGVELAREKNPDQPNVPYYSPIFSEGEIAIYRTGNYYTYILVSANNTKNIFTKIKILDPGEKEFIPTIPESIDLKITNKCYAMCPFCHENSTPDGEHASDEAIEKFLKALEKTPIPEIAVGGGNPLLHPDIDRILDKIADYSFPAVTARDIDYIEYGLPENAYAYGISLTTPANLAKLFNISEFDAYPVVHVINGVHRTEDVAKALRIYTEVGPENFVPAVLILGFKQYGRGRNWKVRNTIDVEALMKKYPNAVLSFDDLAIKQLGVKKLLTPREWELLYNGEDGKYTMYIDLVREEYAKNSYSDERYRITEWDFGKMFITTSRSSAGE